MRGSTVQQSCAFDVSFHQPRPHSIQSDTFTPHRSRHLRIWARCVSFEIGGARSSSIAQIEPRHEASLERQILDRRPVPLTEAQVPIQQTARIFNQDVQSSTDSVAEPHRIEVVVVPRRGAQQCETLAEGSICILCRMALGIARMAVEYGQLSTEERCDGRWRRIRARLGSRRGRGFGCVERRQDRRRRRGGIDVSSCPRKRARKGRVARKTC